MPYNPYNPYGPYAPQPQYQPQYPQQPQPSQDNVYAFVNGVEGAKSYQLRPNQSVMLMDSEQPICYMKQSNAMGQATLRYFKLTEIQESDARGVVQPTHDYVSKSDFDALAKRVDSLFEKKED